MSPIKKKNKKCQENWRCVWTRLVYVQLHPETVENFTRECDGRCVSEPVWRAGEAAGTVSDVRSLRRRQSSERLPQAAPSQPRHVAA